MKKIFILPLALIMLTANACSFNESSEQESTAESRIKSISEASAVETTEKITEKATEKPTENVTETESVIKIGHNDRIKITSFPKAEKLDLGEVDKYSLENFKYQCKFIYFTDYGRYYDTEIGGRNSANWVLCLDRGYGDPEIFKETEDSCVIYCDKNILYISKSLVAQGKPHEFIRYKLEDDKFTVIDEAPFECGKRFIGNYIYYSKRTDDIITVYQMNKNKEITKTVKLPKYSHDYVVYENKIWYEWWDGVNDYGLSFYDLVTGESKDYDEGRIGIINNGYMYYSESGKLMRINLSNCEYEFVCGVEKDSNSEISDQDTLWAFNYYGDYILYSLGNTLYRLSDNENTPIFSTGAYYENDGKGFYIYGIQCEDNRIFLKISSGAFYQCFMEIDIDGNIIEVIHEDQH